MGPLNYLTVQDILWINFQVAKKVEKFNYAKLEEATFYQYAYGDSKDVPSQAARFLRGFLKLGPIDALNEATGIVGLIAFLEINGYEFELADASGTTFVFAAKSGADDITSRIKRSGHGQHAHKPDVRATIESVLRRYPKTIEGLLVPLVKA